MISDVLPYDLRVRALGYVCQSDVPEEAGCCYEQEGWTDIQPIAQDEPVNALAAINYDPECVQVSNSALIVKL